MPQLGDCCAGLQLCIVVHHDNAVGGGMYIELDAGGARIQRQREAGECVFARKPRHPAVGNAKERTGRRGHGGRDSGSVQVYVIRRDGHRELPLNAAPRCTSNLPDRMTDAAGDADEQTDLDLITRWKGGDERAATLLVERHAGAVARFAASVGARGEVQDIVQDTFVRAFASLDSFRGDSSLRTWLFTIARRLLLDLRRSERRRGEQVEVQDNDTVTEYDALDGVVAEETRKRLHAAVARLSKTQREVFTLRVNEGLSYKEIADVAGTTEGAARVHYHNAMRAIKEFLDE